MTSNRERLFELDVLKGIMIFAIVLYHSPEYMRAFPNVLSVFYRYGGDIGNTLFFALSGFTMCYAYADRSETMELSSFITNRIMQICFLLFVWIFDSIIFVLRFVSKSREEISYEENNGYINVNYT